ncbi:calmodulin-binding-domain-containing protein [Catenaria anguillulae PL171]|uniref:Calmodulin-binding-domain-containing protein n=1 Tax=Catenaria anguillulae PL171 TaxID=765915 RepID=A0A1Y2HQH8_9FUNG|nr:calmodulin-binding-domain-containing protein [Catenaria anguillulae PL171]
MLHSPRIPSAAAISKKHSSSAAIHDALNPSRGIRDDIARRGGTPKNHAKENARQLKVMQEKMRAKKEAQELLAKQAAGVGKRAPGSAAYSHVPSRLYLASSSSSSSSPSSGASTPLHTAPSPVPPKRRSTLSSTSSLTGGGRSSTTSTSASPLTKSSMKKSASSGSLDDNPAPPVDRKTKVGEVPAYLVQRKQEWAKQEEERRQKQIEKETWPPGTVPVPEDERLATLQYLQQSQKELTLELSRFPITLTPASVQRYRRQQEVLAKLREVEKGIEVYSQARVFMAKVDDEAEGEY